MKVLNKACCAVCVKALNFHETRVNALVYHYDGREFTVGTAVIGERSTRYLCNNHGAVIA